MLALFAVLRASFLLLDPQSPSSVSSHPQAATEQFNYLHYLSGAGPYIQNPGFGISTDIPHDCNLEQIQLFSRHGARYPTINAGKRFEDVISKLQSYNGTYQGDMAFLNQYEYFAKDRTYLYEQETTPTNCESDYSGSVDSIRHGREFRKKYNSLFNKDDVLPLFSSNSARVYATSKNFAMGFLGSEYDKDKVIISILDESSSQGLNSLTPRYSCPKYNKQLNDNKISRYDKSYLDNILSRFLEKHPSLNLETDDIEVLFQYIAYEVNVKGFSPFAKLFKNEEYVRYGYSEDLSKYYANSRGNPITLAIGSVLLNASLTLMKETERKNKIWLSFSHDTDWEIFHAALGIFGPQTDLPVDYIPFPNPYNHAFLLPQGARLIAEKYSYNGISYVRFLLNDAVYPIPNCLNGPGFSCPLEDYEKYVELRIKMLDVVEQCAVPDDVPHSVSFYWDYGKVKYEAQLINE